jgi:uncharacterized membrane protein
MTIAELEAEALKLPVDQRAKLAEKLLESLQSLTEEEHRELWHREALRRDAELTDGSVVGRDADDVMRDARARLK